MTTLERIKNLSKTKGLSLQDIALKAGMGKNTIYKWGKQEPSFGKVAAVAKVLNVSTDYLLGKTDEKAVSSKPKEVDIEDNDVVMTFEGRPIPPEDLELMKRLLRGGRHE